MRTKLIVISLVLLAQTAAAWAVLGVKISDLNRTSLPPNPIKVWGKVTSVSPLKVSDGRAEVTVAGIEARVGDMAIITGNFSGGVLTAAGPQTLLVGPALVEMVYVPAGQFVMGTNLYVFESPAHTVNLPGYWIGKYEVTRGEYRQFMNAGGYSTRAYWSDAGWSWKGYTHRVQPENWETVQDWATSTGRIPPYPPHPFTQTDNHPVAGVTYYEAEAFCAWAGGRLPTIEEWEKAGRWDGTASREFPWGNSFTGEECNTRIDHNPAGGGYDAFQTAPVGSYPGDLSHFGCFDMGGNIEEWCCDWWQTYPGCPRPDDRIGSHREPRGGGSWFNDDRPLQQVPLIEVAWWCRLARRGCLPPNLGLQTGVRMAR